MKLRIEGTVAEVNAMFPNANIKGEAGSLVTAEARFEDGTYVTREKTRTMTGVDGSKVEVLASRGGKTVNVAVVADLSRSNFPVARRIPTSVPGVAIWLKASMRIAD